MSLIVQDLDADTAYKIVYFLPNMRELYEVVGIVVGSIGSDEEGWVLLVKYGSENADETEVRARDIREVWKTNQMCHEPWAQYSDIRVY